jgi:hypothetical protein
VGWRVKPQEMRSEFTTDSTKLMASALLIATCSWQQVRIMHMCIRLMDANNPHTLELWAHSKR